MQGLFDHEKRTIPEALEITRQSLLAYGQRYRHWCVAFSGGKDSSATLAAVIYLIESGQVPKPASLTVIYADTRLELPNLRAAAMGILDACQQRGYQTRIVYPRLDKRFYVMILGRGIPPSHSGFRWCTGAIKIDPMTEAMAELREAVGEKLLMIIGLRLGESANRDKRISLACSSKNGGECGHGWYEETTPAEVADVLSPLLHWRTCNVWDFLRYGLGDGQTNPHERGTPEWKDWYRQRSRSLPCHGFDCSAVCDVYGAADEASEQEILARTGCLVCPVASRDLVLERTITKPEWAYLAPLLRLRAHYEDWSQPHNRIQKVGERTKSGDLSSRPMRLGPLQLPVREKGLAAVLAIQDEVNTAARLRAMPEVELINPREQERIRELIAARTWPDGWDGTEVAGGSVPYEVHKDGTIQHHLFGMEET